MSTAPDDIRSQLTAAMAAQREPEEVDEQAPPVQIEKLDAAVAEIADETTKTLERARDASGRFVAKDTASELPDNGSGSNQRAGHEAADAAVASTTVDAVKQAKPEKDTDAQVLAPSLAPPNGWTAEAKAKWHELPSEVMAAVQQREKDIAKFTSTRDEHAAFGKDIYQVLQPYMPVIKAEGGTPRTAIESLAQTAYILRTGSADQKRSLVQNIIRAYGVDLGTSAQTGAAQQPANAIPLDAIQAEVDRALAERDKAQQQAQVTHLQTEVQTELEAFAADPKHPHFETVKGHMAALIGQGAAKDLQDAYDQAVWAKADTRATLLAQQRADEEQKRRADAKAKADAAKRKNVSLTGGPGNTASSSAPGGRGIREELEAALATHAGGV